MPIRFQCSCGRNIQVKDDKAGKRFACPDCGQSLVVPKGTIKEREAPPLEKVIEPIQIQVDDSGETALVRSSRKRRRIPRLSGSMKVSILTLSIASSALAIAGYQSFSGPLRGYDFSTPEAALHSETAIVGKMDYPALIALELLKVQRKTGKSIDDKLATL